jgi:hypothetical protein
MKATKGVAVNNSPARRKKLVDQKNLRWRWRGLLNPICKVSKTYPGFNKQNNAAGKGVRFAFAWTPCNPVRTQSRGEIQ